MVGRSEYKWCFEGIVKEAKQVAVDEQLAAQQGNEAAGVPLEPGAQFEDADQQQCDQCCPNLDLQDLSRSTDESLDRAKFGLMLLKKSSTCQRAL